MNFRNFLSYATWTSAVFIAALSYSCAANKGDIDAQHEPAAKSTTAKPATSVAVTKTADIVKPSKPQVLPSPPRLTATVDTPKKLKRAEKPATKPESKALQEARVTRSVAAQVLNIRSKPSTDGDIVGRLVKGSQLPVEIKGEWAKIGDSQYVQTKFLSPSRSFASAK